MTNHSQHYDLHQAISDGSIVIISIRGIAMNAKTYGNAKAKSTPDSADAHRVPASFIVELGTVTSETKQDLVPVAMDSHFTVGTIGS